MTKKKIIGIRYHYDDHTSEYVHSVSDLSATSIISFRWFSTALTKFKNYWKKNND